MTYDDVIRGGYHEFWGLDRVDVRHVSFDSASGRGCHARTVHGHILKVRLFELARVCYRSCHSRPIEVGLEVSHRITRRTTRPVACVVLGVYQISMMLIAAPSRSRYCGLPTRC